MVDRCHWIKFEFKLHFSKQYNYHVAVRKSLFTLVEFERLYCSHEIKICLLLGRKVIINLDRILKSRDIILTIKVHLVKAMVSLVDVRFGLRRKLSIKKLMLLKCGAGEDS